MYVIRHLLHPQRQSLINRWKKASKAERSLIVGFSISGAFFWLGLSGLMFFFIHTFHGVEIVGTIVLRKLIELLLLSTFGLLCFSNVVTALSNYYLSDDLELLLSLPISKVNSSSHDSLRLSHSQAGWYCHWLSPSLFLTALFMGKDSRTIYC